MAVKWWWRRANVERLTNWALYLLQGRRYRVELTDVVPTGAHYPKEKLIRANPGAFGKSDEEQFTATQGVLAHEVGHALFTGAWPDQREGALCLLVNILEDERIERAICTLYPGIEPAIRFTGDLAYGQSASAKAFDESSKLNLCLAWRWAHSRDGEPAMLKKFRVPTTFLPTWERVRPLVEAAWVAPDTTEVIRLGREVLRLLGIRETQLVSQPRGVSAGGISRTRGDEPLPLPDGPADIAPGLELSASHGWGFGRRVSNLAKGAPFIAVEDAAHPLAWALIQRMQEERPESRPTPHEYRGRFNVRQELRSPETPCLVRDDPARRPRSLALAVLLDRSGSMQAMNQKVRLATMALSLACEGLEVPLRVWQFGGNETPPDHDLVVDLAPGSPLSDEDKALIAGYEGTTGSEMLSWCLPEASGWLTGRPERLKALIVVHDGEPVYPNDRERVAKLIPEIEHEAVVIGLCLDADVARAMRDLFARLVVAEPEQLPERLASLLEALY